MKPADTHDTAIWQEEAARCARIMSQVTWTPVAETMPNRKGGFFPKGVTCTGVPYSSVKWVGRYIGFDIFLKTFLAAVENPLSVLYSKNLAGTVTNAACYYGMVCSAYTSYALQCGTWIVSRLHGSPHRDAVVTVEPQDALAARVGDVIFTPPKPGSHVELVTGVCRQDGTVSGIRVEDSWPPTTRCIQRSNQEFATHIGSAGRVLYRITDLDAWRGANRAEAFRFPNYEEDARTPQINRVLLLDRGDWVVYAADEPVTFNVMDRDRRGATRLVLARAGHALEEIDLGQTSLVERACTTCADYQAYCIMADGSRSQAVEFSVGNLDMTLPAEPVRLNQGWNIEFAGANAEPIFVHLSSAANGYGVYTIWLTEKDRRRGVVTIPPGILREADLGQVDVWLVAENRYGRLKKRGVVTLLE